MSDQNYMITSWHRFYFVITPEEFKMLCSGEDFYFVEAKVGIEKSVLLPKEEVCESYERLFTEIISSIAKEGLSKNWFQCSIMGNGDKMAVKESEKISDKEFEMSNLPISELSVGLQPFDLHFQREKSQILVNYFNPEGIIGLRLVFAKQMALANGEKISTDHFNGKQIYDNWIKNIKKISKKAKIRYQDKEILPNFWVSESAKRQINQNYFLQKNDLSLI